MFASLRDWNVYSILYFASILQIVFCILYFKYSPYSIWYFGILTTSFPVFCILVFQIFKFKYFAHLCCFIYGIFSNVRKMC